MSRTTWVVASVAAAMLLGCGGSVENETTTGQGGAAGTAGTGGSAGKGGTGGTAGTAGYGGGVGGTGGTAPYHVYYGLAGSRVDKIDLLFVIDNSASMADKQDVLAQAVPGLVGRLIDPRCMDASGNVTPSSGGTCPAGFHREFEPVADLHIGVISSSLGGHGADSCSDVPTSNFNPRMADMSHLIARGDPLDPDAKIPTWNNKGFLLWDAKGKYNPPGDSDPSALIDKFTKVVVGTGQDGCGFEASLEAWYRFLVDPAPYEKIVPYSCDLNTPDPGGQCRGPEGIDQTVLTQRADFVRPDSLLAVLTLTDENDCSVIDGWQNYIAVQTYSGQNPWHLPRATSQCATDPASPQCMSCAQGDFSSDPECSKGLYYSDIEDSINLRCFRQKQRFGLDFLYPIRRYTNGLSKPRFDAKDVAFPINQGFEPNDINPLFCSSYGTKIDGQGNTVVDRSKCLTVLRNPQLVLFAPTVGVPWQDVAKDPNDLKKGFRSAEELAWTKSQFDAFNAGKPAWMQKSVPPGVSDTVTVWDQVVGKLFMDPASPDYLSIDFSPQSEPLDPLMIESISPRTGTNPATGTALAPFSASSPDANPINGHEWDIKGRNDLQYACTFKFPTGQTKDCSTTTASCDCAEADGLYKPLCQADDGSYGKTQYRAKAYPGRRFLAVARGIPAEQAVVGSICPANMSDPSAEDFGYTPVVSGLVDRMRLPLNGTCVASNEVGGAAETRCKVVEAAPAPGGGTCPACSTAPLRNEITAEEKAFLLTDPMVKGSGLQCMCAIDAASTGVQHDTCVSSTDEVPTVGGQPVNGWCYVDPTYSSSNGQLNWYCPAGSGIVRMLGQAAPQSGHVVLFICENP